ncbi:heavy metal translocating P-type ATPase [Quadrisphaera sp. INWT6]|uniref:heavy metal translocating P-type ATPase n=1 Tax=Quadrisphaera sp. INWT6 TaxID=2596917 RepID=UPI0018922A22|nr:heavy metal translocating P-type ATPase [Quadrisphaera sp. INWT6]MBF5083077.1 heavy metal translocating P-type ATPase [Quadrisphaera sp. INWT6]
MTSTLSGPASLEARPGGRVLAKPPSLISTGIRLPEVRWAALALLLFLVAWPLQLAGAPAPLWWGLYLACYLAGGWEPAWAGITALREKTLDVDLLMIVAAIAAASIGQVFDGALLIVIFATSGALEALVTQRTADSVSSLLTLAPERATLVVGHGLGLHEREVDTADLVIGDVILIRPGERIGGDGVVIHGVSEVDQAAVTGESVPVRREVDDEVLSGTVNGTGALTVRITRAASDSVIARVVTLVREASETKAARQLFIEKVEQRYSLGVVIATLVVFCLPLALGQEFQAALLRAITFMIVASPCAVVLSTMPPLLAAIANAGRHGVLVKSATVMERLGRTQLVAFDKTGTLTQGAPEVVDVSPAAGRTRAEVLGLAAAVERHSEHPLGQAIVRAAVQDAGQDAGPGDEALPSAADFRALPGRGVEGVVGGRTVSVLQAPATGRTVVGTVVHVLVDGDIAGTVVLHDALRADAAQAVAHAEQLTERPVHLLTGDNDATATDIAARTGITAVHAHLLPADKAQLVTDLEAGGVAVMVVGDGVNDAPALAAASTGAAMGRHGSDLALETADLVIIRDELAAVPAVVAMSRRAHRIVVANLAIAATFIVVLVTWDLVGSLPLPLAVAGHEGSTVIVALNGLRLLRRSAWPTATLR